MKSVTDFTLTAFCLIFNVKERDQNIELTKHRNYSQNHLRSRMGKTLTIDNFSFNQPATAGGSDL